MSSGPHRCMVHDGWIDRWMDGCWHAGRRPFENKSGMMCVRKKFTNKKKKRAKSFSSLIAPVRPLFTTFTRRQPQCPVSLRSRTAERHVGLRILRTRYHPTEIRRAEEIFNFIHQYIKWAAQVVSPESRMYIHTEILARIEGVALRTASEITLMELSLTCEANMCNGWKFRLIRNCDLERKIAKLDDPCWRSCKLIVAAGFEYNRVI